MAPDSRRSSRWVLAGLALLCAWRAFAPGSFMPGWLLAAAAAAVVAWRLGSVGQGGVDDGYVSLRDAGVPLPAPVPNPEGPASPDAGTNVRDAARPPTPALPAAWTQPSLAAPLPAPAAHRRARLGMPRGQAFVVIVVALLVYLLGLAAIAGPSPLAAVFAAAPYAVLMLALSRSGLGNPGLAVAAVLCTALGLVFVGSVDPSSEGGPWAPAITGTLQFGGAVLVVIAVAIRRA
jgi:hypothetical protein